MIKSKCVLVRRSIIEETLKSNPTHGSKLLEPFKSLVLENKLPFKVLEDSKGGGDAELHKHEHDLWLCLEGEVTFTYGGRLLGAEPRLKPDGVLDKNEVKGSKIEGGAREILYPGDWLWIPAGEPHQHNAKSVARLMIIKIPANLT